MGGGLKAWADNVVSGHVLLALGLCVQGPVRICVQRPVCARACAYVRARACTCGTAGQGTQYLCAFAGIQLVLH